MRLPDRSDVDSDRQTPIRFTYIMDNLHYNSRHIDSYNFWLNFIISEREAGKSTRIWRKVYKKFKKTGQPTLCIRRLIADITETYINDICSVINKFLPENKQITFDFKKGSIKEGIVDVKVNGKLFIRVIALSNPLSRIKSLIMCNPAYIVFDEFICNVMMGEKYLNDEAFRFKEIYNTFQREVKKGKLKCYFMGNPYSLYNPYFSWLGVDTLQLRPGAFIVNKDKQYAIECYKIKDDLRAVILERNPLYQFDESYAKYAFDGVAVNDANIPLRPKQPDGFRLKYVILAGKHKLLAYSNYNSGYKEKWWIDMNDSYNTSSRLQYAVSFDAIANNSKLVGVDTKVCFLSLRQSIRSNNVTYSSLESYYLIRDIYTQI